MKRIYQAVVCKASGDVVPAKVMAERREDAVSKLLGRRVSPLELKLSVADTINVMFKSTSDPREMAQFYRTLGRRLERGAEIRGSVRDAMEYVVDPLLKSWIGEMEAQLDGGAPLADAMMQAGFPMRDSALVRAMAGAGQTPRAFLRMSEEYAREDRMARHMRSLLVQPVIFYVIAATLILGATLFALPHMEKFFRQLPNMTMPAYAAVVYKAADWFDAHEMWTVPLYLASALGFGLYALKGRGVRKLLFHVPAVRRVVERADAATALGAFALLYESAMPRDEAAKRTAEAARREETRQAFIRLAQGIEKGLPNEEAARRAGFPSFLDRAVVGALAARDADSTVEGLTLLAGNLAEDAEVFAQRLEQFVGLALLVVMANVVMLAFFVVVFPMISTALSQV